MTGPIPTSALTASQQTGARRPWQDRTRWRWPARLAGAGLIAAIAFAAGARSVSRANATTAAEDPFFFIQQLAQVLVLVENEYVDPVDRERLIQGAITGMVAELDPHSAYLTPSDYTVFRSDTQGEFGGIGVEVDFRNDAVTIIAPIEGSPAANAGLRPGDVIVAINKESVQDKSSAELVRTMRGSAGTPILLTVRRAGRDKLLDFNLRREIIQVSSIASKSLDGNIAYLRIKQFQAGTHTELLQNLAARRNEQNIEGLILDLRNNPGGLVDEATQVADEFLRGGVIYSTRHRDEIVDEIVSSSVGAIQDTPMVVLVNEFSASASELLAGALQDNKRASVVGAQTFGKGSVQSIVDLPGGAGLRLTTLRYYTPKGHAIQATGINPDVLVEAAYVPDTSFGIKREQDLTNHLPSERIPGVPKSRTQTIKPMTQQIEDLATSPTYMGVAKTIPKDPTGGPDFALSIGYQIVRGILKKE
jgi:carboxyl-terminal processing protease